MDGMSAKESCQQEWNPPKREKRDTVNKVGRWWESSVVRLQDLELPCGISVSHWSSISSPCPLPPFGNGNKYSAPLHVEVYNLLFEFTGVTGKRLP